MSDVITTGAQFEHDGKFHLIEKAIPAPTGKQVLIRVSACGICGTDLRIIKGHSHARPPVILGHEFCGMVVDRGGEVKNLDRGDYIVVDPNMVCGTCRYCRSGKPNLCQNLTALGVDIDGGFSGYCLVPETQCHTIPRDIPPEHAALTEPLSCALYGIRRLDIKPGQITGIVGGGFIGNLMAQLALLQGASRVIVIEPDRKRRESIKKFGITDLFSPDDPLLTEKINDLTQGGCERVIECVGNTAAARQSLEILRPGGTLVVFGVSPARKTIPLEPYDIYRRDITIRGSFLNPFTFSMAIEMIVRERIDLQSFDITSFPLSDMDRALQSHINKESMKVIIIP